MRQQVQLTRLQPFHSPLMLTLALFIALLSSPVLGAEATPSPQDPRHILRQMVGRWQVQIDVWMAPDQPPMTSTITAETAMAMGDRFLVEKAEGTFLGLPSESMTVFGYDDHHRRFELTSLTSFSGATLRSTGEADPEGGRLVFHGEVDDAMGRRATRSVYTHDDQGFVLTVFELRGDTEVRVLRSTYRPRTKSQTKP